MTATEYLRSYSLFGDWFVFFLADEITAFCAHNVWEVGISRYPKYERKKNKNGVPYTEQMLSLRSARKQLGGSFYSSTLLKVLKDI